MGRRKTHAEFVAEVEALVGDEYTVIGDYIGANTKIKIKHNKCSYEYEVRASSFIRGSRCVKCAGNAKKTTEEFKQEVFELVGDEYTVIGEYENCRKKLKMRHNECSHVYEIIPFSFLAGTRCAKCAGLAKKTTEEFKQEVFELVGDEYTVMGSYVNSSTKLKMKHKKCSQEYEVQPRVFLEGKRCPKCNESKGERQIAELLSKIGIRYTSQYKFKDCCNIRILPFDFAVFNENKSLKCLIEYDGEQHFNAVRLFGGEKKLNAQKQNDAIKTKYCADHNIPLIRIPYWEFDNIDEILTKELRKLGVIETEAIAS